MANKSNSPKTTLTLLSNGNPIEIAETIIACSPFSEVLHPGEEETFCYSTVITEHMEYQVKETPEQVWAAQIEVVALQVEE